MITRPGWSHDDRAWALALSLHEANRCPGCGGDLTETTDPDFRWVPQPPTVCHRCVGLHASHKAYEKHPDHRALLHTVTKTPKPKRKKAR